MIGLQELDWDTFASNLKRARFDPSYDLSIIHALVGFRTLYQQNPQKAHLISAAMWFQHTLCSEPRDKIYSLLGVIPDGPNIVPLPSYKQPLEMVLASATRNLISTERSLDILCLKGI
jgi:hypothetical protein